jgi:hypothetical protein
VSITIEGLGTLANAAVRMLACGDPPADEATMAGTAE